MVFQLSETLRFREWKKFCSCSRRREAALIWVPTDDNARTNVRGYTILFQKSCPVLAFRTIRVQPRKFIPDPSGKCYLPRQARAAPEGSVGGAAINELGDELKTNPFPDHAGCPFVPCRIGRSTAGG
jgi:hypothetical protein